jgi:hypothetical protein
MSGGVRMSDDFSDSVKRILAARVGYLCSGPECRAPTAGPQDDPAKAVNLGVAAHITAASVGGPRYDPTLTPEERSAPTNGIWLCQNCAKLIDNDVARFSVELLKKWKNDAETEAKARVGKTSASSIDDFFVDVDMTTEGPWSWNRGADTVLRYIVNRFESRLTIERELGYLSLFEKGGPISPLDYVMSPTRCPFKWDFPILDFKVLNNRKNTLFLTEIVFDIEESRPDTSPLFAIKKDTQQRFAGELHLINEGGSVLTDLNLSFHLFPGAVAVPATILPPYPHAISLPLLEDHAEVDVVYAFRREGVDIDGLIGLSDGKWDAEAEAKWAQCLGRFKDEVGTLAGEISFRTSDDSITARVVKFVAPVYLANRNRMGILRPPSYNYGATFDVQRTNYEKRVSISHSLQAGEPDRFTVKLAVSRSSFHRFRASLRDISGTTWQSFPIELHCFVPRSRQRTVENAISAKESAKTES